MIARINLAPNDVPRVNLTPQTLIARPPGYNAAPAPVDFAPPTTSYVSLADYGAIGDGQADDSNAIQACVDDAWAGNFLNESRNRGIYVPRGYYRVRRPIALPGVLGVKMWGDGGAFFANVDPFPPSTFTASIGPEGDPHNDQYSSILTVSATNAPLFIGDLISGGAILAGSVITNQISGTPNGAGIYRVVPPQTMPSTGGLVALHSSCFHSNGLHTCTFEHLQFQASAGGIAFDFNWDGALAYGQQLCRFQRCGFAGVGGGANIIGCRVGAGAQSDTSTWADCFFGGVDIGISFNNFNAICHNIYGGDFQSNRIAILCGGGTAPQISGVGFQLSSEWDIAFQGGAGDSMFVSGCSTESRHFLTIGNFAIQAVISGCAQRDDAASGNVFVNATNCDVIIDGCRSVGGKVLYGTGPVTIRNCLFRRTDALASATGSPDPTLTIENSSIGDAYGSIGHRIRKRRHTSTGVRNYDIEAASLTDPAFLYDSFSLNATLYTAVTFSGADVFGGRGIATDEVIAFTNVGGALPSPLAAGTAYYAVNTNRPNDPDKISIAATPGGAAIVTSGGSGEHRMHFPRVYSRGDTVLNTDVAAGGSPGWICVVGGHSLTAQFKPLPNVGA